ncbi:MAG: ABC transporter permease [Bacillaceae bacterium]|nr:ABC transporter permease [Bacillaceae bacterium]
MFNPKELWKKRLSAHLKVTGRYMRLMFNDHLAFALLFFVAVFAYYYQQWLQQIPANFPADWIMAIVFGSILTYSPIRTLLKKADMVFLLPVEQKLDSYFRSSMVYSLIIQVYILILAMAAFSPLYFAVYPEKDGKWLIYFFVLLFIYKGWNMLASWWMLKIRDAGARYMDSGIRFFLNVITIFFFLQEDAFWYAVITTAMFFGILAFDYSFAGRRKTILWDVLVEKEDARMQSFYRLANLFTDVPQLKQKVKKRSYLVSLLTNNISFQQRHAFPFLYRITFARSGDYTGLYIRLLLLAVFFVLWVPNIWAKYIFGLLFIYLSGFQLLTLWKHHRTIEWMDLYPVNDLERRQALFRFIRNLLVFKGITISVVFLFAVGLQEMILFLVLSIILIIGSLTYWNSRHIHLKK